MAEEYLRAGYLIGFPLGMALAHLVVRFNATPVQRRIDRFKTAPREGENR